MSTVVAVPNASSSEILEKKVITCGHCFLVQFDTISGDCRRCHKPLPATLISEPATSALIPVKVEEDIVDVPGTFGLPKTLRFLRDLRGLSQRQLAHNLDCARTYISKLETGKAIPTLGSLRRLARGYRVSLYTIVSLMDAPATKDPADHLSEEVATRAFLEEIAPYVGGLSLDQRGEILAAAKRMSAKK